MDSIKKMTRTEFARKQPKAYFKILKETPEWLDEEFPLLRKDNYWNLELCKADAFKHNSVGEWHKSGSGGYGFAAKNGWVNECCAHMDTFITLEKCKKQALPHKNRVSWEKQSGSHYSTASRRGWLDECCSHMRRKGILLPGEVFSRLTVVSEAELKIRKNGKTESQYLCRCECGKVIVVSQNKLKTGGKKSCGCQRGKNPAGYTARKKTKNLDTGFVYRSITEAAYSVKVSDGSIRNAITNGTRAGSFRWAYYDEKNHNR